MEAAERVVLSGAVRRGEAQAGPHVGGEDERAGRWSGTAKTECGLHSREG